jgi:hypothetical protein
MGSAVPKQLRTISTFMRSSVKWNDRIVFISVLLATILLVGCDQTALPARSTPVSSLADKSTEQTPIRAIPSPTIDGRAFATAKAQFELDHESTRVAEITASALTPTHPIPTYPPYETPVPLSTGVRQIGNLGMKPCDCAIEGPAWRGIQNGWYLNLYAGGSVGFDSGQGMVLLDSQPIAGHTAKMELFNTPTRSGEVRIVSADGVRVTMLSTDGTQFVFDAGMRAWIPPSGTPIPAPTVGP